MSHVPHFLSLVYPVVFLSILLSLSAITINISDTFNLTPQSPPSPTFNSLIHHQIHSPPPRFHQRHLPPPPPVLPVTGARNGPVQRRPKRQRWAITVCCTSPSVHVHLTHAPQSKAGLLGASPPHLFWTRRPSLCPRRPVAPNIPLWHGPITPPHLVLVCSILHCPRRRLLFCPRQPTRSLPRCRRRILRVRRVPRG